jgi:hypothetical protein
LICISSHRKLRSEEGYLTGKYLEEKIVKGCMEVPGAREEACKCTGRRVVEQVPSEELNKLGEDKAVNEKVVEISVDCALETKEE